MAKNKYNFEPEICECCGQAKTYLIPIDWGTALIVKALARAIRIKGINAIHMTKEMEIPAKEWSYEAALKYGKLTSNQIGNSTKARVHGLIAKLKGEPGNWLLTTKGANFLRGEAVPSLALIRKTRRVADDRTGSHKEEYFQPEKFNCTVNDVSKKGMPTWEGIDFEIREGRIVTEPPVKTKEDVSQSLF